MRIAMSHRLICLKLHPRRVQGGVSLIIVLIMLVIIGLTSAAAMRSATSAEKVTNSVRLQNLAQQYAEAALRYCEAQLALPAPVATLDAANIVTTYSGDPNPPVAWQNTQTWGGGGGANASLTVTPASWVYSADSTNLRPGRRPECVVERRFFTMASAAAVTAFQLANAGVDPPSSYLITARGFSTDYTPLAGGGTTESGSVVWLQSQISLK
jgi:type IV pilus assembly protein PilX